MGEYRAHGEFFKGVRAGIVHACAIMPDRQRLPPIVPSAFPFYHGFRAGLLCAWRWKASHPPGTRLHYQKVRPDRYVAVAWRRYERIHGR